MIFKKNIIKIKDKTKLYYDLNDIVEDNSLKGLFVKEIMNRLNSDEYDKETVEKALEIGLDILEK